MSAKRETAALSSECEADIGPLPIDDPVLADAWLRSFEALSRRLGFSDERQEKVTDLFLTRAGLKAIGWATAAVWPLEIDTMQFSDIKKLILENLQQRQLCLIARRVSFVSMRQMSEETARQFAERLRQSSAGCEFQAELEQLTLSVFIVGLRDPKDKTQLMASLQLFKFPVSMETCLGLLEHLQRNHELQQPRQLSPNLVGADDPLPVTSLAEFTRQWRSSNCTYSELFCDDDDDEPPSLAPTDVDDDAADDATRTASGVLLEAGDNSEAREPDGMAVMAGGQLNQSNAWPDSGGVSDNQNVDAADSDDGYDAASTDTAAAETPAAAATPVQEAPEEAMEALTGTSCSSQPIRHSISKKYHVHVMSHLEKDICVEEDAPEDLEATTNNLILLMDDVHMALKCRGCLADRESRVYWSPLTAAKTPFRVFEFN